MNLAFSPLSGRNKMKTYLHNPDSKLWYKINWIDWLEGLTITVSVWKIPTGVTKISDSLTTTETAIEVSTPSATTGQLFTLTNHVTLSNGEEEERSFILKIRKR
jgi:hypothetical protein